MAPGQGSAYLQDGKLVRWSDVNPYAPYCALAVREIRWDAAQLLAPDAFAVGGVYQRVLCTLAAASPLRHARRDRDGDGVTYEVRATVMQLSSPRQPDVRALTCASWGLPQSRSHLTVMQIRRALGAYFTLELGAPERRGAIAGNKGPRAVVIRLPGQGKEAPCLS